MNLTITTTSTLSTLRRAARIAVLPAVALVAASLLQAAPAFADDTTPPKPKLPVATGIANPKGPGPVLTAVSGTTGIVPPKPSATPSPTPPKPSPTASPTAPKPSSTPTATPPKATTTPTSTTGTGVGQNGTSCTGPGCVAVGQNAQCAPGTVNCNINQSATVNNNNTFQTNISTTVVESNPTTIQVVQAPDPTPVVETVVQEVAVAAPVEVGISIDRGLGGEYAAGDLLGVSFVVSQPMDVVIEVVLKDSRVAIYQGHADGPTSFTTFVPPIPGLLVIEINGTTADGHTAKDTTWLVSKPLQ